MKTPVERLRARLDSANRVLQDTYGELARLIDTLDDPESRGAVNAMIWQCAAGRSSRDRYFSQCGQDAYLDTHVFGRKRGGVFVDVGAYDGITGSNTLFFEVFRGWSGLLIDAVEEQLDIARDFRKGECLQAFIGDGSSSEFMTVDGGPTMMSGLTGSLHDVKRKWVEEHPKTSMRMETCQTRLLGDILLERGMTRIDFLSLDIEGAELQVIESFPFDEISVTCWSIEAFEHKPAIDAVMEKRGFVWLDRIGDDDLYVPPDLA